MPSNPSSPVVHAACIAILASEGYSNTEEAQGMLSQQQALELMRESLDSLHRSGLLCERVDFTPDTVLLGPGSPLDSMAFVTFITELEERLNRTTGKELYIVLTDVHEFNSDKAALSGSTLAQHLVVLSQK